MAKIKLVNVGAHNKRKNIPYLAQKLHKSLRMTREERFDVLLSNARARCTDLGISRGKVELNCGCGSGKPYSACCLLKDLGLTNAK